MFDYFFHINTKPQKQDLLKKVLIVLKKTDNDVLNMQLLSKIMAALKFSLEEDCLMYEVEEDCHLSGLMKKYEKIIIFGLDPSALGLNMPLQYYKINKLEQCTLLFAHPLGELKIDDKKKSTLWKSLQIMFDLVKN
jgi:hypothetical protein